MLQFVAGEQVELPAIPFRERVVLPAAKSAVIVVDMQNDFVQEGGTLVVPAATGTVAAIGGLLARARTAGVRVAYTQDTHLAGDREWQIWPEHCRQGTWGWEIIPELAPQPADLVCVKSRYDGFYDTWLDAYLTRALAGGASGDRRHGGEHLRAPHGGLGRIAVVPRRRTGGRHLGADRFRPGVDVAAGVVALCGRCRAECGEHRVRRGGVSRAMWGNETGQHRCGAAQF